MQGRRRQATLGQALIDPCNTESKRFQPILTVQYRALKVRDTLAQIIQNFNFRTIFNH